MNEIKNILICGLGAIGSVYAAAISEYDHRALNILVDKDRLDKYTKNPRIFNNKIYNFNYTTPQETNIKADLIIIAVKNNAMDEVIANIKNFVKEDTIILSLLNGLQSEDMLIEKFGEEKVLYSYFIGHTSTRNGNCITHDGVYNTVVGKDDNSVYSEPVKRVKSFFDKAGIKYEIPIDMKYARWWKFIFNVGYNQASSVLNTEYKYFQNCENVNNIAINLMEEAVEIAKAQGVNNTEKLIPEVLEALKMMLPEASTSMLQDITAKRQTEVDAFASYICKLGKEHNIPTPYNSIVYDIIKAMEEKNSYKN